MYVGAKIVVHSVVTTLPMAPPFHPFLPSPKSQLVELVIVNGSCRNTDDSVISRRPNLDTVIKPVKSDHLFRAVRPIEKKADRQEHGNMFVDRLWRTQICRSCSPT